jgi:hypothetical protein
LFNQDSDYLCPLKDWFTRNAVEAKNILSIQLWEGFSQQYKTKI